MKFLATFLSATFLAACGAKTSDEQRVREVFDRAEKSAEARDASDVLDLVSSDYGDSNGSDKAQLQDFLRGYFLAHPKLELLVSVDSLEFPVDGLAQAAVTVTTVEVANPDRESLAVELRRVDGEWRVTRADRIAR